MATSAAILNFTAEYSTNFLIFACLIIYYFMLVMHKTVGLKTRYWTQNCKIPGSNPATLAISF